MSKMYNIDTKEKFLSDYPSSTRDAYKYLFYRSFGTEDILGRDLYTFTTDEIKDVLISAEHTTLNSVRLSHQVIVQYLTWAAKNGYTFSTINQAKNISVEELRNYIDYSRKLHLSEEELEEVESKLVNYQDRALLRSIFEGVNGYQHSELLNLTVEDVRKAKNNDNKLELKDDKYGERSLNVSDRCMDILLKAGSETEYHMRNGEAEGKRTKVDLVENEYLIKSKKTRNVNYGRADRHLVYRAISTISELFELPYLSPKNIEKSGMIKMAKDLLVEEGQLENEQLAKIAKRFNVKQVKVNGYDVYNYSLLREFINLDNIKSLYNI